MGVRTPADRIKPMLRPLVVAAGVIAAGAASMPTAHADPPPGSPLTNLGIGNNGPMSNALAGMGQSICPMLVQPGATVASIASQLTGSGGVSPGIAGMVATMAIQMGCPGFMQSLANGQMPGVLQGPLQGLAGNPGSPGPLGLPGANPAPGMPMAPLGANPAPGMPMAPLGANPAPGMPMAPLGPNPAPGTPVAPPQSGPVTTGVLRMPFM
ncbi:hypothetical protein AWC20_10540 [Mycobacterium parmense]|nr:hypothetical protein AWC20_10540 [Mycobacterium parmense]